MVLACGKPIAIRLSGHELFNVAGGFAPEPAADSPPPPLWSPRLPNAPLPADAVYFAKCASGQSAGRQARTVKEAAQAASRHHSAKKRRRRSARARLELIRSPALDWRRHAALGKTPGRADGPPPGGLNFIGRAEAALLAARSFHRGRHKGRP